MSNAEQTAEDRAKTIMTLGKLHERGELDYPLETATKEIQAHTNQPLDKLKKKVGSRVESLEQNPVITDQNQMLSAYKDTLQLIEEVQDE